MFYVAFEIKGKFDHDILFIKLLYGVTHGEALVEKGLLVPVLEPGLKGRY